MTQEKCSPDDPRRCQGAVPSGQCPYFSVEGSTYCENHISRWEAQKLKKEAVQRYMIDQQDLKMSYLRQRDDVHYLDMKDEIHLIQALIEEKINAAKSNAELISSIPALNQLFGRLESMKATLLKMQQNLDLVLGKEAVYALVDEIAAILDEELVGIPDKAERLDNIAMRIIRAIENASNKRED